MISTNSLGIDLYYAIAVGWLATPFMTILEAQSMEFVHWRGVPSDQPVPTLIRDLLGLSDRWIRPDTPRISQSGTAGS